MHKVYLLLLGLVLGVYAQVYAQGTGNAAAADPRWDQVLKGIATMQSSLEEPLKLRAEQYTLDLAALEKSIASDGKLDNVLKVKNEREAWEKGEPTRPIDPKDDSMPLGLRKLRYYFDQDVIRLKAEEQAARGRQTQAFASRLQELEVQFTKESKLDLALAARKARQDLVDGKPVAAAAAVAAQAEDTKPANARDFTRWLGTVRFVLPRGIVFRVDKGKIWLTQPKESVENPIAIAKIDEANRTITWELNAGVKRTIRVVEDLSQATIESEAGEETLEVQPFAKP